MIGILAKLTIKSGTNEEFEKAVKKMSEAVKMNLEIYITMYIAAKKRQHIL